MGMLGLPGCQWGDFYIQPPRAPTRHSPSGRGTPIKGLAGAQRGSSVVLNLASGGDGSRGRNWDSRCGAVCRNGGREISAQPQSRSEEEISDSGPVHPNQQPRKGGPRPRRSRVRLAGSRIWGQSHALSTHTTVKVQQSIRLKLGLRPWLDDGANALFPVFHVLAKIAPQIDDAGDPPRVEEAL